MDLNSLHSSERTQYTCSRCSVRINCYKYSEHNWYEPESIAENISRAHTLYFNFTHISCVVNFSLSFWYFGDSVVSNSLLLIFHATNLPKQILFIGFIYFEIWVFRSSTMYADRGTGDHVWFDDVIFTKNIKTKCFQPMWFCFLVFFLFFLFFSVLYCTVQFAFLRATDVFNCVFCSCFFKKWHEIHARFQRARTCLKLLDAYVRDGFDCCKCK